MLNVGALHEGFVLDHIKAGKAMTIYHDLKLDKLDCTVAIIKNAKKPSGAKPAKVVYDKFETAVVTPDKERVAALLVKG